MQKLFWSAALSALALAFPAAASAEGGYLGLSYSHADQEPSTVDVDSINVGGAVNFDLSDALEGQVDGAFTRVDADGFNTNYNAATLHIFHRTEGFAIGGFVGYDQAIFSVDSYSIGVEGQAYLGRLTLDAAIGAASAEVGAADRDGMLARLGGTLYATDNLAFSLGMRRYDVESIELDTVGLNAEWRPDGSPLSFLIGYRDTDGAIPSNYGTQTWEIGLRWNLGSGTLLERGRSGPAFAGGGNVTGGSF